MSNLSTKFWTRRVADGIRRHTILKCLPDALDHAILHLRHPILNILTVGVHDVDELDRLALLGDHLVDGQVFREGELVDRLEDFAEEPRSEVNNFEK